MPRDGSGVFSAPAGTKGTAGETIQSAPYNAWIDDIVAEMNGSRPIVAGGTGANTAVGAFDKLNTKGTNVASATTVNLTTATGARVNVTGTSTTTGITLTDGAVRIVRAVAEWPLTASSTLIINGSDEDDYTAVADDLFLVEGYSGGVVRVWLISPPAGSSQSGLNDALFAFKIADLEGVRLNMVGGIADAYDSEDDVDTAASTNESYDAGNDLYSPSVTAGSPIFPTNMTSASAPSPYVVTTTNAHANGPAFRLFDDTSATYWQSQAGLPQSVTIDLGSGGALSMGSYKLGAGSVSANMISAWDIYGSNNGTDFTLVDSQSGETGWSAGELREYTLSSPSAAYRYWRIVATAAPTPSNFIVSRWQASGVASINNMTLVSDAFTATAVPTTSRIAIFIDPQESITVNTDLTVEVSRDNGTSWTTAVLASVSNPVGTVEQWEDNEIDISGQTSGSTMLYRIKTLNNKDIDVTGIVFQWS